MKSKGRVLVLRDYESLHKIIKPVLDGSREYEKVFYQDVDSLRESLRRNSKDVSLVVLDEGSFGISDLEGINRHRVNYIVINSGLRKKSSLKNAIKGALGI